MAKKELTTMGSKSFEDLKKTNEQGAEYWSVRELQPHLGYTQWRRFEDAIKRAMTSCKHSGSEPTTILPMPAKWLNLVLDVREIGHRRHTS